MDALSLLALASRRRRRSAAPGHVAGAAAAAPLAAPAAAVAGIVAAAPKTTAPAANAGDLERRRVSRLKRRQELRLRLRQPMRRGDIICLEVPCATRWLTVVVCTGWWGLGCSVHSIFDRAFLRAFPAPAPAPAHAGAPPGGHGDGDDSEDNNDSFQVKMGKRMSRGRRAFQDPLFNVVLAMSCTMLRPLHSLMGVLFKISKIEEGEGEESGMVSTVVKAVDCCVTALVGLLESNVRDPFGKWFAAHFARGGGDALGDAEMRRYARKETLRILAGNHMRQVVPLSEADTQLWLAIEAGDPDDIEVAVAFCQERPCCLSPTTRDFYQWLQHASVPDLEVAKQSWVATILRSERDHAGNQQRCRSKRARTKTWRRQVATYIAKCSKDRWVRNHKERKAAMRRRCSSTWRQLRSQMQQGKHRRCIGGNPMFDYVNEHLGNLRRLGAAGPLHEERRRLAVEYRQLAPAAKWQRVEAWRQQRVQAQAAGAAEEVPGDHGGDCNDPVDSHWGMGNARWPVRPDAIYREAPGGVWKAAAGFLPEGDLLSPSCRRRLKLPRAQRDNCRRKHRGFCETRDSDIAADVAAVMSHLKRQERPDAICTALRFYPNAGVNSRDKRNDLHFTFAALRQSPKYTAMYIEVSADEPDREQDFPFYVSDMVHQVRQVPQPGALVPGQKSMTVLTSWALAVLLCTRFDGVGVVMEVLQHTVTNVLKRIYVAGAEAFAQDVKAPAVKDGKVKARKSRGLDALALAPPCGAKSGEGQCGSGGAGHGGSGNGKGSKRLHRVLGVLNGGDCGGCGGSSDDEPWWVANLTKVGRAAPTEEPPEASDSGQSDDEWFQRQVGALRRVAEGAERLQSLGRRRRRIRRQPAAAGAAAAAAPEPQPREGPPRVVAAAAPLLPRQPRGVPWGVDGRFVLAPVFARGTLKAFSATCRLHTADGSRCNANLTLGEHLTLRDAERRIKEWACGV